MRSTRKRSPDHLDSRVPEILTNAQRQEGESYNDAPHIAPQVALFLGHAVQPILREAGLLLQSVVWSFTEQALICLIHGLADNGFLRRELHFVEI
ncbi:TPA: hypothetical protein DCY67_05530 [Candidatus Acetothermia bacterium]|nr:hypothetical protein [Candidatus Acetothermia bacterium]